MNAIRTVSLMTLALSLVIGQASAIAGGMIHTKQYAAQMKLMSEMNKQEKRQTINQDDLRVLYFGGPVIGNVKVVVVFWGNGVDPTTKSDIGGFYSSVTNSTYMDWLDPEYNTNRISAAGKEGTKQNIGRGSLASEITISPINTAKTLDKVDVEAELVAQIDKGKLPKPDGNILFMIHYPAGITLTSGGEASCQAWCGDHEGFTSAKYGYIYYAMMPDVTGSCRFGCGFGGSDFDSLTVIASHELVEAVTDPMCPNIGQSGAFPAAWLAQDQNEVGDLCADGGAPSASVVTSSKTYAVQSEWNNSTSSCKGGTFNQ